MFTPKQDVRWCATRFRYAKEVQRAYPTNKRIQQVAAGNYTELLMAVFTVLFNERQAKRLSK